jgi:hypothetical protein
MFKIIFVIGFLRSSAKDISLPNYQGEFGLWRISLQQIEFDLRAWSEDFGSQVAMTIHRAQKSPRLRPTD